VTAIPRDLVARSLQVAPEALPPGDLPVARLAERWMGYLRDTAADDAPEGPAPQEHPEFWTFALIFDLAREAPDLCLDVIVAALPLCRSPEEVALVAAGPLEDVIAANGPAVIDRIETLAPVNARLRFALTGVWPQGSAGTPLWHRIEAARAGETGIDGGAPLPD
jgi:hypothetical protein